MSTVDKSLSILDLFSESQPNLGTTEIARQLGWDKSNVQRYLRDLAAKGFLEQDSLNRSYNLGPALTHLAMVRNRTHPIEQQMHHVLDDLVRETGETAHASSLIGHDLITTALVETKIRGTRVFIDPAVPLPLHATGSGIALLSRSSPELIERVLQTSRELYTDKTPSSRSEIANEIARARDDGYSVSASTYELDVMGIAAPIIGYDGHAIGAIAVATPMSRVKPETKTNIGQMVMQAAARVSEMYHSRKR